MYESISPHGDKLLCYRYGPFPCFDRDANPIGQVERIDTPLLLRMRQKRSLPLALLPGKWTQSDQDLLITITSLNFILIIVKGI